MSSLAHQYISLALFIAGLILVAHGSSDLAKFVGGAMLGVHHSMLWRKP